MKRYMLQYDRGILTGFYLASEADARIAEVEAERDKDVGMAESYMADAQAERDKAEARIAEVERELQTAREDREYFEGCYNRWRGAVDIADHEGMEWKDRAESAECRAGELRRALREITHPGEGLCPVCAHVFDAHIAGCPYEAIDAVLAEGEGER